MDIVGALLLGLLVLPLALIVSAVLWHRVGRNVLFAHERIGKDGRTFKCLKFRTMVCDADRALEQLLSTDPAAREEWQTSRKLRNDPRIISGVGNFLRQTSLDELPQFWNVLRGDMSLVGPRPVVRAELDLYGASQELYLSVRPGLTGLWQVGDRSDTSYEDRVSLDAHYVRNWTLIGDLELIFRTGFQVVSGRSTGAY